MADPVPTPDPTPAPAPAAWHAGLDADTLAFVSARGLDKLDANAALLNTLQGHRAAEKLIGTPAENLLRKPKDAADTDNWNKLYETIGVPTDPKDYDFSDVKKADGSALDDKMIEIVRTLAASAKVSKDGAKALARDYQKSIEAADGNQTADYTAKLDAEKEALKVNWGAANYAVNLLVAQKGAEILGFDKEAVSALEKVVGYAKVMEACRRAGVSAGEDKFVSNQGNPVNGALTVDQAKANLSALQKDSVWVQKYESGDATAGREFNALTTLIAAAKQ